MKLEACADIRTGLVLARKEATGPQTTKPINYKQLNLKCIEDNGTIDTTLLDDYQTLERLRTDYLTQTNDILVRLSAPFTPVIINEETEGLVIPSHFVIIRTHKNLLLPAYLYWLLNRQSTKKQIYRNITGSMLGTIKSSFFAEFMIKDIPLQKQEQIAAINELALREVLLLQKLAEHKETLHSQTLNQIYKNVKRGTRHDNKSKY